LHHLVIAGPLELPTIGIRIAQENADLAGVECHRDDSLEVTAARKWRYWLQTGMFDVEDAKPFEFQLNGIDKIRLPGRR
jgi:hypothetical protein